VSAINLIILILVLTAAAYVAARQRAIALAGGLKQARSLHSLPSYYGSYTALYIALPALLFLLIWSIAQPSMIEQELVTQLPAQYQEMDTAERSLILNDVINMATGGITSSDTPDPAIVTAADNYNEIVDATRVKRTVIALLLAVAGFLWSFFRISPSFRARNQVELIIRFILLGCSMIAILTTIGIFLSVIFESIRFFQMVPITDFLFGLQWSPQTAIRSDQVGSSGSFGAIPLFTGTLLIAIIVLPNLR